MDELISKQIVLNEFCHSCDGWSCNPNTCCKTEWIRKLPVIQPEIIYCGDGCKFWNRHAGEQAGTCDILRQCTSNSFYCGNAKRNEVNNESN